MRQQSFFLSGLNSMESGRLHDALKFFREDLKHGGSKYTINAMLSLSQRFIESQLWREAEETLLEVLRTDPLNYDAKGLLDDLQSDVDRFCEIREGMSEEKIAERRLRTHLSKVPRVQLFIEITNNCNGRCVTCLNRRMKRSRGVMDFELFKDIVDRSCRELYLDMVHLYGVGESYLVEDVIRYFDYAVNRYSKLGVNTVLITNGERVSDLHGGISITDISFNAGKKGTYELITGLDFNRTLRNIWRLEREGQLGQSVNIHMLVFEENKDEVEEFKKLFAFTSANLVLAYKFDNQCGEIDDLTLENFKKKDRIPCHYVRNVINVTWNGDVILCPHDFDGVVTYGNLKEKSFKDIWYSNKHVEMLLKHSRKEFDELCKRCNFNVPIEDQNVVIGRKERIELRKKYLDFALKEIIGCPHAENCEFVKRYREEIECLESDERAPLIRICSDDYRFYGIDAVLNEKGHAYCNELIKLREKIKNVKVVWEAPAFGPSGYAFAARSHMVGLSDLGVKLCSKPIWGDCKVEVL